MPYSGQSIASHHLYGTACCCSSLHSCLILSFIHCFMGYWEMLILSHNELLSPRLSVKPLQCALDTNHPSAKLMIMIFDLDKQDDWFSGCGVDWMGSG